MTDDDARMALEAAGMTGTEAMLLEPGNVMSLALLRAKRRDIEPAHYCDLVAWAAHLRVSRGLSVETVRNYGHAVGEFLEWMKAHSIALEAVSGRDIESWQQSLYLEHRQGEVTRHVKVTALRRWFGWRAQTGRGGDPARGVQSPKRADRVPRKYSPRQLQRMFEACDEDTPAKRRDRAVLLFFLSTGARRSEVAGLRLHQLEVRERIGAVRFLGKGAKERMVSFEGPLVPALKLWLADRDALGLAHDYVFAGLFGGAKGKPLGPSGLYGIVMGALKRAKLTVERGMAIHTLRANFATAMYDQTKDIEAVRILLGHDDINTTRKYIAISDSQMNNRLNADYFTQILGGGRAVPLWFKKKLDEREGRHDGE